MSWPVGNHRDGGKRIDRYRWLVLAGKEKSNGAAGTDQTAKKEKGDLYMATAPALHQCVTSI
jgi:hypothetical protein